jgi:large subunit ribosomal protein L21
MYAIVKTGGKQYRVERGQRLLIERLAVEEGSDVTLEPILYRSEEAVFDRAGLERVKVTAKVLAHVRGEKLRVFKFKPKRGYKRRTGHRQDLTQIEVTEIVLAAAGRAAAKPDATAPAEKPAAAKRAAPKATAAKPSEPKATAEPSEAVGEPGGPQAVASATDEPKAGAAAPPAAKPKAAKPKPAKPKAEKADKPKAAKAAAPKAGAGKATSAKAGMAKPAAKPAVSDGAEEEGETDGS